MRHKINPYGTNACAIGSPSRFASTNSYASPGIIRIAFLVKWSVLSAIYASSHEAQFFTFLLHLAFFHIKFKLFVNRRWSAYPVEILNSPGSDTNSFSLFQNRSIGSVMVNFIVFRSFASKLTFSNAISC